MHMYLLAYVCMSVCAWYVIIDDGKGYEISLEHKCLGLSGSWDLPAYEYWWSSFRIKIPFVCKWRMTLPKYLCRKWVSLCVSIYVKSNPL